MKKLIQADTVDANGTVWETVGENITGERKKGAIQGSESSAAIIIRMWKRVS